MSAMTSHEWMNDSVIGRPFNWPTVKLADPMEFTWILVKSFAILLCNYNSDRMDRIKNQMCIKNLLVNTATISHVEGYKK